MAEPITTAFRADIQGMAELEAYSRALAKAKAEHEALANSSNKKIGSPIDPQQLNTASQALEKLDRFFATHGQTVVSVAKQAGDAVKSEGAAIVATAQQVQTATGGIATGVASLANSAKGALSQLSAEFQLASGNAGLASRGILALGAAGGVAGMGVAALVSQVVSLGVGLANSAKEVQLQGQIFRGFMANLGQSANVQPVLDNFKSMRAEAALLGLTGNDLNVAFRRNMLDMGNSAEVSMEGIRTAMKLAAVSGGEFAGIMDGMGKAVEGNYRALGEAGIHMSKDLKTYLAGIEDPAERMKLILQHTNELIKDQATGLESLTGQQKELERTWKLMNIALSAALIEPMTATFKWINDAARGISQLTGAISAQAAMPGLPGAQ